jgi:hypothetical protein
LITSKIFKLNPLLILIRIIVNIKLFADSLSRTGTSDGGAGLNSGQSNQKRNIRVHRGDRRERREKKLNDLCVLCDLCGETLLGPASDLM